MLRWLLIGMLVGMLLTPSFVHAYRTEQPPTFLAWDTNTLTALNNTLQQMWHVLNGRYQLDVVTVDPDGNRSGSKGEMVYFDTGTDQLCVNSTGAKAWVCVNLT